jgi:NAD(P)-dependent dehydrogenase (short-subunit alcohol dehydrogenase family)
MRTLSNKVAIITGASSGIGRATAELFSREGALLVLGARRKDELDRLVDELTRADGRAIALAGDVCDERYAEALVALALEQFGGLDIAFNNAGTLGALQPVHAFTLGEWEDTLRTNLTGAFLSAKYQVPAMIERGGGSIIFNSSFVGHTVGLPDMGAYAASKAGLVGLTQVLAVEQACHGIRVNALLPGGTDTPMGPKALGTPESLAFVCGLHALKRLAASAEIAKAALYLASDMSSFTTGSALLADGGVSINRT